MNYNILITAYAVNPNKGSEDGTGWNIIRTLSQEQKIIAITRRNNREAIERYRAENPGAAPETQLDFAYYDLPQWLCWWKKGSRGALLYHYLWHLGVVLFIMRKGFQFTIAHHLNFHCSWSPTFLWLLGKPVVWGPVGHHPKIPKGYLKHYSRKEKIKEALKWLAKKLAWKFDPFLNLAKHRVKVILGVNSSIAHVMGNAGHKVNIIPAIATEVPTTIAPLQQDQFNVLSIGRFIPLKGFDMLVEAFAHFYHQLPVEQQKKTKLTIIGKGPDEKLLHELIQSRQLPETVVQIIQWIPKDQLPRYFQAANVFFFPSHEGAGMVVPEAMSYGLPVLTYDNYGPGESIGNEAGIIIPYTDYDSSTTHFAGQLEQLFHSPQLQQSLGASARQRFLQQYTWEGKVEKIQLIYQQILAEQSLMYCA